MFFPRFQYVKERCLSVAYCLLQCIERSGAYAYFYKKNQRQRFAAHCRWPYYMFYGNGCAIIAK